ncbi:glycosyltransferase family 9 protein [Flavobacterium sp. RSB2_4_14]|uniref:glycosyltransferase family 9 protein n=1 Tax=Flavobacterium sp. RSB2_4_14 TaxID=3447665 RepID=UPI003F37F7C2
MKVLVIQIKMIGDVLASTVICETIKRNYPTAEVHYLIQQNTYAVVDNNPFIDKVIFFEPNDHKGFLNLYKFGIALKNNHYDIVIDAYCKWDSILPAYFSGAKIRVGHYKSYTRFFYTHNVHSDSETHDAANAYRLLLSKTALGKDVEMIFPKIHLRKEEIDKAKIDIKENCDTTKPIFMISILGSGKNKSLPPKNMAATLDVIANTREVQLIFNYTPNQYDDVKAIYDLCLPGTQSKINLSFYAKSLRDFIALLSQCDCLIGNEGGATNISKALSKPTFTIFSPWIRRKSWDSREDDDTYCYVHLLDYYPEIYNDEHPKKLKKKTAQLYDLLVVDLYKDKLVKFINNIKIIN